MEVFHRFTDLVEPVSIDEAFLDVTGSARAMGDGRRDRPEAEGAIRDETQLTASVGVATSKLVAKVASDMQKPDGLVVVPPGDGGGLPRAAAGAAAVGRRAEDGGDAREAGRRHDRGPGRARARASRAAARDPRPRPAAPGARRRRAGGGGGVGRGEEPGPGAHLRPGHRRRRAAAGDAPRAGRRGRGAAARPRPAGAHGDAQVPGRGLPHDDARAHADAKPTDSGNALFRVASELFAEVHRGRKVRLLGIYASHFGDEKPQLDLFDEPKTPSPLDRVRDEVQKRFGDEAITAREPARPPRAPQPLRQAAALIARGV